MQPQIHYVATGTTRNVPPCGHRHGTSGRANRCLGGARTSVTKHCETVAALTAARGRDMDKQSPPPLSATADSDDG